MNRTTGAAIGVLVCVALLPAAAVRADDKPGATFTGVVTRAIDGNTVRIQTPDSRRGVVIRLIGLEAPRKATRELDGQEPWGTRAQQFLSELVTRQDVKVELDVVVPVQGEVAVRWGYLWLGDRLVNEELLRQGHAVLVTQAPNVKYVERLQKAQVQAREAKRGVWDPADPLPEPPSKFVARKQADTEEQKGKEADLSIPAWVPGCVIGNTKTKKFHIPGGQYYESSKTSANAIFFKNAEDALKAGYTQSAR